LFHPYILAGQIATAYYFMHYLGIVPLIGLIDNVLSLIGSNWKDLPHPRAKEEWRILLEADPAKMSKNEKELWIKAKQEIISKNIIVSPNLTGGTLI
jgi:hypothetical protein